MNKQTAGSSYLLRVWQVPIEGDLGCRAQLENIRTGEKLGFASLDELIDYIQRVMAQEIAKPNNASHSEVQG